MHAMHCARNIALCPQCDEPIPRHELEQHMKEECEMRKIECDRGCGTTLAISKLENHKVMGTKNIFMTWNYLYVANFRILRCVRK